MELIKDFLPVANFSCCLAIIVWIAKNYLKPYLSENVKSTIQKRDKEELTHKEEGVRAKYSNDLEHIKHQLNQVLGLKTQHKNEERQSLIRFLENCNKWIFAIKKLKVSNYFPHNLNELKLKIDEVENDSYLNINLERVKILLFITNIEVNESLKYLTDDIESYKAGIKEKMNDILTLLLEQSYSSYEVEIDGYLETHYGINNIPMVRQIEKEYDAFNQESFDNCKKLTDEFAEISKKYLISSEFNKQ